MICLECIELTAIQKLAIVSVVIGLLMWIIAEWIVISARAGEDGDGFSGGFMKAARETPRAYFAPLVALWRLLIQKTEDLCSKPK